MICRRRPQNPCFRYAANPFFAFLEPLHYAATPFFHVFLQESIPAFSFWTFLKMSISKKSAYFFLQGFFIFYKGSDNQAEIFI
jgi:hypothetical protein